MNPQDNQNTTPQIPNQNPGVHPWQSSQPGVASSQSAQPVPPNPAQPIVQPTAMSAAPVPTTPAEPVVQPIPPSTLPPGLSQLEPTSIPLGPPPKRSFGQRLKGLLRSKKFWFGLLGVVLLGAVTAWFVQPARWWIVNTAGARNTLTITTISPGEGKAKVSQLRNVAVTVAGQTYQTDEKGKVIVKGVPYGKVSISAKKAGYQDVHYGVTLDYDPFLHKFGGKAEDDAARSIELSLKATGIPVSFKVVDWLSDKPVTTGEFVVGDAVAKPDDQGLVTLRVTGTDAKKATVNATFGGAYVDKKFEVTLGSKDVPTVTVVPGGKHYFISKRTGTLTVYRSDLDGSNVDPVVTGTGQETDSIVFAASPDGKFGVLSSSRDGARNGKKDLLQRVYIVDLQTKQLSRVDEGVNVRFADWSGNTLVYTTTAYDETIDDYPKTLRSVDVTTKRVYNFETSDDISVSTVAFDKVVYQKYINSGPDQEKSPVMRVASATGSNAKTLGEQTNYDGYMQLDFDRIAFKTDADQAWHEYNLNTDQLKTVSQPNGSSSLQYLSIANSDGSRRLYVERIDGKYALTVKETATGATKMLYGGEGLSGPIRWIGNTVVYRVATDKETADYVISLNGGGPKKIADVTATANDQADSGGDRFEYY